MAIRRKIKIKISLGRYILVFIIEIVVDDMTHEFKVDFIHKL